MWTDATFVNERGGEVYLTRFEDGKVGMRSNEAVSKHGYDLFEEYDFLEALWLLYPNGLPVPVKPLTKQEKQIRALTVFFMNEDRAGDYDNTPYTVDDYDEMMHYWNVSGPKAREKAEKMLAVVEDVED